MGKLNDLLSKIITKLNASVKTDAQSFSEEEKTQARENIGLDNIDFYVKDYSIYRDAVTGYRYIIEMRNGSLTSTCMVASIKITTPPTKTSYTEGVDTEIDLTGMVVEAVYEDGSSVEITDYTCSTSFDDLVDGQLVVSYESFGSIYTTSTEMEITLVSSLLNDFEYTKNDDGTYELTAWKGTLNGETSTEIVVPDNPLIVV